MTDDNVRSDRPHWTLIPPNGGNSDTSHFGHAAINRYDVGFTRQHANPSAFIVDELQHLSGLEFSALIMALHKSAQKGLPLLLVGAGLPQVVGLAGRSKSYAERLFDFPEIGPLTETDAALALSEPAKRAGITYDADALKAIHAHTRGYPYFLQEWGYQAWNLATPPLIDTALVEQASAAAIARLDEGFFRVRFDRLTPRERDYMLAMAQLGPGPHRSGEIAKALGLSVRTVAPIRSSLIDKGTVYCPAHGDTAFTVPLFDQYLRRVISEQLLPTH